MSNMSEVIRHRGRRFKRNSVSSSAIIDSSITSDHSNPSPPLSLAPHPPLPVSSPSCSLVTHHATTSCSRPVILTPAHPPILTSKGRPMSAKGRPRSGSYIASDFKKEFSLKQSQPLPPIDSSSLHHQPLYEVDSAVDLEYNSLCCTPEDTPLYSLSARQNDKTASNHTREEVHYIAMKLLQDSNPQQETQHINVSKPVTGNKQSSSTAPLDTKEKTVQLCLKLPSGERLQAEFTTSQTISELVSYAQEYCDSDLSECEVATNSVPRQVITDWQLTLAEAGITVRTLLYLSMH